MRIAFLAPMDHEIEPLVRLLSLAPVFDVPDKRHTTGFLCVYPKEGIKANLLHKALNHGSTLGQLALVGKSYGDGAIKVEPGGMRKLIVPYEALDFAGIKLKR